ncbi:MAG: ribose 5-phosphate isomerase A [Thermoplasmata archaeon]|nr:ribose 5-phosphate isomerase A [Thermoplasmata archaeon]
MPVAKKVAGEHAARYVKDGMVVGLGSGSTIVPAVRRIAERMREEEMDIIGIPTSEATASLARELDIPISVLEEHPVVDLTIDGADEVDPNLQLIKGLGGALVREKIVAAATKREIIVVDDRKMVPFLGSRSPLPVEVVPFCWQSTRRLVETVGCRPMLRENVAKVGGDVVYTTDNGNYILDCDFERIDHPHDIEVRLNNMPGVVENGLFLDIASVVIIGYDNGETRVVEKGKV